MLTAMLILTRTFAIVVIFFRFHVMHTVLQELDFKTEGLLRTKNFHSAATKCPIAKIVIS